MKGLSVTDNFEDQTYENLKCEFEEKLKRNLSIDEKVFLQLVSLKHVQER